MMSKLEKVVKMSVIIFVFLPCLIIASSVVWAGGPISPTELIGPDMVPEKPLDPPVELRVGYLATDQMHLPHFCIADKLGFWKDEGIIPVYAEHVAGAYAQQHLAAGEVDVIHSGVVPAIIAASRTDIPVVLAGANVEGSILVVAKEINSWKELDGTNHCSVGIGSVPDLWMNQGEIIHGIKTHHVDARPGDIPMLLKKRECMSTLLPVPWAFRSVELGNGKVLDGVMNISPGST